MDTVNDAQSERLVRISGTTAKIMVVDDDQVSVMAIKRAFKRLHVVNPITVAKDGQEAWDIILGECRGGGLAPPYFITLDINMPRMTGFEFLAEMQKKSLLQYTVILVLSTSDAPRDIEAAYASNVAGYIVKDNLQESLARALDAMDDPEKTNVSAV